jgi:iron complex outermembrane recepter protein
LNAGMKYINWGGGFTMDKNSRNNWRHLGTLTAALVATGVLSAQLAQAQTSASGTATATNGAHDELEEIVVTGTPIATKLLDTSFAITVLNQDTLKDSPAIGLAALLSDVPGLYGEASGGEENLNISPRGVRGGFLEYISLQEDGLPVFYNGFLEELEFRPDLGTDRVEITRGGPSGVMTSNGAGAIVNFISRRASDHAEGEASLSYSSFGSARLDFFYGTPLGNSTSATISGYYRRGDGAKNVGYDANHGGQVKGTLTRLFDNGEITVTYKLIDDHTQFFLPQPVKISQDGSVQRITPITGFNASTANLQGPQTENVDIKTPAGSTIPLDLADGIWEKSNTVTLLAKYDWQNGLTWKDTLRYANINTVDNDLRNLGGNSQIMDANAFLASSTVTNLIAAYASQGAVGAKLVGVASGNTIANPGAMNGNGLVTQMGINQYIQRIDEVINNAQLNFSGYNNVATLGLLTWDQRMHVSQNGVNFLMDVTNHANLLDVVAVNAAGQTVGHLTDNGVLQYDTGYGNGTVDVV